MKAGDQQTCLDAEAIDAISAISIAQLTKPSSILPISYLDACIAGSAVLTGRSRGDCTVEVLALSDLQGLMEGRPAVSEHCSKTRARIFRSGISPQCTDARRCSRTFSTVSKALLNHLTKVYAEGVGGYWANETGWQICKQCHMFVEGRGLAERLTFWDLLSSFFKLKIENWGSI